MKKVALFQNKLVVKKSRMHGYGVFAGKKIRKGEKIEECYFILTRGGDKRLDDYYFYADRRKYAVFLGFGSIYNHATDPNADYTLNLKTKIATITAAETIQEGEEICVSYGNHWFKDRGYQLKTTSKKKTRKRKKKKA